MLNLRMATQIFSWTKNAGYIIYLFGLISQLVAFQISGVKIEAFYLSIHSIMVKPFEHKA